MGRFRRDGQCCGWEAQCGRRTKINWTKTAYNTCICTCIMLTPRPCADTHTLAEESVTPDSQQQQQQR